MISLTFASRLLHINLTTAGFLFVIIVSLVSLTGSFVSSIIISVIAALCLAYLAPPDYSFRVNDPLDVVAIIAFLTTSMIIARLVSSLRKMVEDALLSVSYKVIEAEEQERKRLAWGLHDDIGQRLSLLVNEIDSIKKASPDQNIEVRSRIDAVHNQTLEILTDVKDLAHELHSLRFDYLGLAPLLKTFCSEFGRRKKLEIDFKSDSLPSFVPPDISLCLFRVLQEALHNAIRHSGAREFDVRLHGTSDEITLAVSDYGSGFDVEVAKNTLGLGLNHMRERLKLVKGILIIDSQSQGGTTIRARVPLNSRSTSTGAAVQERRSGGAN